MRKSGNYFSWSLFAVLAETVFLFLMFLNGQFIGLQNLLAIPILVLLFICFRQYIEWRDYVFNPEKQVLEKVKNESQLADELRSYVVRDNIHSGLMFSLLSTLFLIASNYIFVGYSNVIFSMAFIASITSWIVFNVLIEANFSFVVKALKDERVFGFKMLMQAA